MFQSAAVNQIVTDSCADCHSNLTKWPWYTNVAPASWLVMNDVKDGRTTHEPVRVGQAAAALDEIVEKIQSGEMPPLKYKVMPNHSNGAAVRRKQKTGADRGLHAALPRPAAVAIRRGGGRLTRVPATNP